MEMGRKFQNACIRRFEGEEVEDLKVLGEKTLQAIGAPQGQTGKHGRSSSASMARMPVHPGSMLEDGGSTALTDNQFSVSILKLLLVKHNDSKYMYNRCLVNRKWSVRNSNLHSNTGGKKSLSS
ncbi:hypothetical protein GGI43DRAFT_403685 [Trichoderma evansii]